jgi:hypothetical protein
VREYNGEVVKVTRSEVKGYIDDPYFIQIFEYWHHTKLWGMPNGNGWANEPIDVLEGITALELEAKAIEAEALEKHDSGRGQNNLRSGRS